MEEFVKKILTVQIVVRAYAVAEDTTHTEFLSLKSVDANFNGVAQLNVKHALYGKRSIDVNRIGLITALEDRRKRVTEVGLRI